MELDFTSPARSFSPSSSENEDPFIPYLENGYIEPAPGEPKCLKFGPMSSEARKKEMKSKTDKRIIRKCDQCPYSTRHRGDFHRHLDRHRKKCFACRDCNMPFMTLGHLNGHRKSVHGINNTSEKITWRYCEKCDYKTRHSSDIARHRRRHDTALDCCKHCNRPFCHLGRLMEHVKREHGDTDIQSVSLNEKQRVKISKNIESITETTGIENYVADNNDTENKTSDSDPKDVNEDIKGMSNQQQEKKQSVARHKEMAKRESEKNKRNSKDKTKMKKRTKTFQIDFDKNQYFTEHVDNTEKDTFSVIEKTNTVERPHENTYQADRNFTRQAHRNIIKCAFCGFSVTKYNDLQRHLDEHDIDDAVELSDKSDIGNEREYKESDIDDKSRDYVESLYLSDKNMVSDAEDNYLMSDEETEEISQNITIDNEAFVHDELTTGIDVDSVKSDTDSNETMENKNNSVEALGQSAINSCVETMFYKDNLVTADHDGILKQDDTDSNDINAIDDTYGEESVNTETDEFVDAVNIFNNCVAKFESQSRDPFVINPFACSKCFFTTGNIEYLKIHVEAHLFESVRQEQFQK